MRFVIIDECEQAEWWPCINSHIICAFQIWQFGANWFSLRLHKLLGIRSIILSKPMEMKYMVPFTYRSLQLQRNKEKVRFTRNPINRMKKKLFYHKGWQRSGQFLCSLQIAFRKTKNHKKIGCLCVCVSSFGLEKKWWAKGFLIGCCYIILLVPLCH